MTKEDIFRYFKGEATEDEKDRLNAWIEESADNRKIYREAGIEYELLVMHGTSEQDHKRPYRNVIRTVASVAAAVVFFLAGSWLSEYSLDRSLDTRPVEVSVPAGQRMTLTLADGTLVELNAGAKMKYPALFKGKTRKVQLEGEAMFHVTHDGKHPFIVNTFAADLTVLGTRFNVNADPQAKEFAATLIEGKVQVSTHDADRQTVTLKPDQRVSIREGRLYTEDIRVSDSTLWTEGIIDISNISFDRLIKKIEKAYGVTVVIERDEMPPFECTTGKIRISDGIDHAMNMLSQLSDFEYERDIASGIIYIR